MSVRRSSGIIALATVLILPPLALSQQERTTQVFRLEHVSPSSIGLTVSGFPADIRPNDELRTLTVSASPDVMATIEELIADLDVIEVRLPIELTMHIMSANNRAPSGAATPDSLRNVVDELRGVFAYSNFEVLDSLVLRAVDGTNATTSGTLTLPPFGSLPEMPTFYNFSALFRLVSPAEDATVLRLDRMRSGFRVPTPSGTVQPAGVTAVQEFQYVDVGINTDVDIPIGQQVVVGKATVGDSAMILIMSARVIE